MNAGEAVEQIKVDAMVHVERWSASGELTVDVEEEGDNAEWKRLMRDEKGAVRGEVVKLSMEGAEGKMLEAIWQAYVTAEKKVGFGRVQGYRNLLYTSASEPGFGFHLSKKEQIKTMNATMEKVILDTLCGLGYCDSETQRIQFYVTYMKTQEGETKPQDPHIDFANWANVAMDHTETVILRSRRGGKKFDYKRWVPFIALFPLTTDGMNVEIWHARGNHQHPVHHSDGEGRIIFIPYGEIVLLRGDVVHAGGFATKQSTENPRCHLFVYKYPGGVAHDLANKNCYTVQEGSAERLGDYYAHCTNGTSK